MARISKKQWAQEELASVLAQRDYDAQWGQHGPLFHYWYISRHDHYMALAANALIGGEA